MIRLVLIFCVLLPGSCGVLVNPVYNSLSIEKQEVFRTSKIEDIDFLINTYAFERDDSINEILILDCNTIKNIIEKSEERHHLIIIYAYWCGASREELVKLLRFLKENSKINPYFISVDDWINTQSIKKYWKDNNLFTNTFVLDIEHYKYSNSYRKGIRERYAEFTNCISNNTSNLTGFPSYIFLNNDFEILYQNTGDFSELKSFIISNL